jgi:hypothetical protein
MRLRTTAAYAAVKAAHTEAYRAIDAHGDDDPTEAQDKAETAALEAWTNYPATTVGEFKDKLAYAEQREMLYWTGWHVERAGIMRDLDILARHPVSLRDEFAAWRAATEAHLLCDTSDEAGSMALCEASGEATRALLAAPCATPADFMVKTYANLHGECGSTWWGPQMEAGWGSLWDLDLKSFQGEKDLNDAWTRSAYLDLDASDFGACLLAFGLLDFDASAWLDRASRVGLVAILAEQEDGSRGLWLCEDADYRQPDDRIRLERERLRRIAAYDPSRVGQLCAEIERAWPNLIARRAA